MITGKGANAVDASKTINASPTKDFFISILGRDITLIDSVKDLVDNCVDGARRIRPNNDYTGLSVSIEISPSHFLIVDNCGGIPVEIARDYAFRFGRPANAPTTDGSIGQFGVGMKRALFKIGDQFEIKSKSATSSFSLTVDVNLWKKRFDEKGREVWELEFDEVNEQETNPSSDLGTTLQVTRLHPTIATEFGTAVFTNRLAAGLQEAHEQSMERGLEIEVNDIQLHHRMATLLSSPEIKSLRISKTFPADPNNGLSANVQLTIYAGVSDSDFGSSGWHVICNGRQILKSDKTSLTGWDTATEEVTTPKAHNQFARFRGFAVFESVDAKALPWNTSKSGIDVESRVFQWAKSEMVSALRQVIDFLNKLDAEIGSESVRLKSALNRAVPTKLSAIQESSVFRFPSEDEPQSTPKTLRMTFERPTDEVEFAREFFGVTSAKRAAERAFEYFIERERS